LVLSCLDSFGFLVPKDMYIIKFCFSFIYYEYTWWRLLHLNLTITHLWSGKYKQIKSIRYIIDISSQFICFIIITQCRSSSSNVTFSLLTCLVQSKSKGNIKHIRWCLALAYCVNMTLMIAGSIGKCHSEYMRFSQIKFEIRNYWRSQRCSMKPYIEKGQTI
jgi:hypothetical protein